MYRLEPNSSRCLAIDLSRLRNDSISVPEMVSAAITRLQIRPWSLSRRHEINAGIKSL
jgi:hypothetical protein